MNRETQIGEVGRLMHSGDFHGKGGLSERWVSRGTLVRAIGRGACPWYTFRFETLDGLYHRDLVPGVVAPLTPLEQLAACAE